MIPIPEDGMTASIPELFLVLFFAHWVGDFVCQTRWIADNKGKAWSVLLFHVSVYILVVTSLFCVYLKGYLPFMLPLHLIPPGDRTMAGIPLWMGLNFILHFFTDAITSRISGYWWKKQNVWAFFTTIGFDQFLHAAALLISTQYFLLSTLP